jgi:hypothetical protein
VTDHSHSPSARARGSAGRDRSTALLLGCTVAVALSILHRGHFLSSDEIGMFFQTRSLATKASLVVPPVPNAHRGPDGQIYSHYTVGQSLLAIPFFQIAQLSEPWMPAPVRAAIAGPPTFLLGKRYPVGFEMFGVGLYGPVATGFLAGLFFLFERRLGAGPRSAAAASLLLAGCTHVATLSATFLQHTTEAIWVLGAFYAWHRFRCNGSLRALLLGSLFAATVPHIRIAASIVLPALGGYLLLALWERRRDGDAIGLRTLALRVALPAVASFAVFVLVNHAKWGSLLDSPMLEERSTFGSYWLRSLEGFLLSPGISVWVYSPLLLLAPFTMRQFLRSHRAEASTVLAAVLSTLLLYTSYQRWTGFWSAPGPRYMFLPLILVMLAFGPWLEVNRGRVARASVAVLAMAGAFVQLATSVTSWSGLIQVEGWEAWQPKFGFLFEVSASPLAAAIRALGNPEMYDLFVIRLARGWPGSPPAAGAALAIVGAWAIGTVWLSVRLWRRLASEDLGCEDPESDGARSTA